MILPTDEPVINFLQRVDIANSKIIDRLFYQDYKTTARRLKKLTDDRVLYRIKDLDTTGYIYSTKPLTKGPSECKQIRHKNKRNELYMKFLDDPRVEVIEYYTEQEMTHRRSDGVFRLKVNGKELNLIVEVETGCKIADVGKYNNFFYSSRWQSFFKTKPVVVWIMDQEPIENSMYYPYKWISWNLSNYEEIFK